MTTGLRHLEKWRRILKYSECFLMLTEVVKQILSKPVASMGWNNSGKDEVKYDQCVKQARVLQLINDSILY